MTDYREIWYSDGNREGGEYQGCVKLADLRRPVSVNHGNRFSLNYIERMPLVSPYEPSELLDQTPIQRFDFPLGTMVLDNGQRREVIWFTPASRGEPHWLLNRTRIEECLELLCGIFSAYDPMPVDPGEIWLQVRDDMLGANFRALAQGPRATDVAYSQMSDPRADYASLSPFGSMRGRMLEQVGRRMQQDFDEAILYGTPNYTALGTAAGIAGRGVSFPTIPAEDVDQREAELAEFIEDIVGDIRGVSADIWLNVADVLHRAADICVTMTHEQMEDMEPEQMRDRVKEALRFHLPTQAITPGARRVVLDEEGEAE